MRRHLGFPGNRCQAAGGAGRARVSPLGSAPPPAPGAPRRLAGLGRAGPAAPAPRGPQAGPAAPGRSSRGSGRAAAPPAAEDLNYNKMPLPTSSIMAGCLLSSKCKAPKAHSSRMTWKHMCCLVKSSPTPQNSQMFLRCSSTALFCSTDLQKHLFIHLKCHGMESG
nr:uncharacterized protein LOC102072464 isoform X1 [Zonotrichia albicollis]